MYVELMGYSRPEGQLAEEGTLRNLIFDFFLAGCSGDIELTLPRSRPVAYGGYEDMADSMSPRLACSMDAYEILALTLGHDWVGRSASVRTFWQAALATLLIVEPDAVSETEFTDIHTDSSNGNGGNGKSGHSKVLGLYSDARNVANSIRPAFVRTERRRAVVIHLVHTSGVELTLCIRKC